MKEVDSLKDELATLIKKGLSIRYTSRSSIEEIPTNNSYQSIMLGDDFLNGFRSHRSNLFEKYNFDNLSILDVGANLGENSRLASKRGAKTVYSVEYDKLFTLISSLICAYNENYTVVNINDDATKVDFKRTPADVAMIFSVWPYVNKRIADLKSSGIKNIILETHNITSISSIGEYLKKILPHFSAYTIVEDVDWGDQLKGVRYVINFSDGWDSMSKIYSTNKKWPDYSQLFGFKSLERLRKSKSDIIEEDIAIRGIGDTAYWTKFVLGIEEYKSTNNVSLDNIYAKEFVALSDRSNFDPALLETLNTQEEFLKRIKFRFEDFIKISKKDSNVNPVKIYIPQQNIQKSLAIDIVDPLLTKTSENDRLWIDGYHRLFSYAYHGINEFPTVLQFHPRDVS